jgi:hypothetical protein
MTPKSCPTTCHEGTWGERRYSMYSFSTSALDGGEWSSLYSRVKDPGTHCTGGWVGPRAGLDTEARRKILSPLPGIEPRSPGRPSSSQTLYWLSYSAHMYVSHQSETYTSSFTGIRNKKHVITKDGEISGSHGEEYRHFVALGSLLVGHTASIIRVKWEWLGNG